MSPNREYYDLLEVSTRASTEVIAAAYKALIKHHYPNGIIGDDRIARSLNEAQAVLTDPVRRQEYDLGKDDIKGLVIGEYRVLGKIADGGFGTTYRGEQILTGMPVCIKHCSKVSPVYEQILIDEARSVWDLRHYAIPAMRNLLRLEDGSLALVMSYVPGLTLEEVVKKIGPIPPEHVAWITERILNALKYVHYHGVVHGDVKPGNVIIQNNEHMAVLVDFGLSAVKPTHLTGAKGFTPDFASPEEENGMPLLPESDLYSLGVTMLFALSGNMDLVRARKIPITVPEPMVQFVRKLMRLDVFSRPNWEKEDLCDSIQKVRLASFKRKTSEMMPILGI